MAWDGNRTLGPIALGMSQQQVIAAIPGVGSYFDGFVESGEPFDDASFYWSSEQCGLEVQFVDGIVVDIAAYAEFLLGGENLVDRPADIAIELAGGEVSREGEVMEFVTTTSGVVLWIMDGVVAQVHLEDYSSVQD